MAGSFFVTTPEDELATNLASPGWKASRAPWVNGKMRIFAGELYYFDVALAKPRRWGARSHRGAD